MPGLTESRDTVQLHGGGAQLVLPVKGNTTIYQGSIVALDADGLAIPGDKGSGLTAAGRAEETVANQGADGTAFVRVQRGVFLWSNSGTAANRVGMAHILGACYIEDSQTVTTLSTGMSLAGRVIRVDDSGVAVEIGYSPLDSI